MYFKLITIVSVAAILSMTLAAPMWPEHTCGPEEDLACYPDGSNGKRSPEQPEDVGAYDEEDGVPFPSKRSPVPMWPEQTCGPEEDLACYSDGSNGKRALSLDSAGAPIITGDNYPARRARPIDGDYPVPNDDSYPVKAKRGPRPPVDTGDYAPPDDSILVNA